MQLFNLPDLGEGLPDATIQEWYVKPGDVVKVDQPLAAMETAKAVVEVPSPTEGKIKKLFGEPGDTIETGQPLVEFETDEMQAAPQKNDAGTVVGNIEESEQILEESAAGVSVNKSKAGKIKAPPAVRALAQTLKVDLSQVTPSGPQGSITLADVQQAASHLPSQAVAAKGTTPVDTSKSNLSSVRRMMVQTMTKAHQEVVPVTIADDANIASWPKGTDITIKLIHALCAACKQEPHFNAYFDSSSMRLHTLDDINLGLAVDTQDGLYVPVIHNAQNKDDATLREEINHFKDCAKQNKFPPELLKDATITLSNFGIFAGRYASPIVVPPMVAIIGVGKLRDEVVAVEGAPKVQRIMPISVTFDHRALTGGEAARFLAALVNALV